MQPYLTITFLPVAAFQGSTAHISNKPRKANTRIRKKELANHPRHHQFCIGKVLHPVDVPAHVKETGRADSSRKSFFRLFSST